MTLFDDPPRECPEPGCLDTAGHAGPHYIDIAWRTHTHAHTDDPDTSRIAAERVAPRVGPQARAVLTVYAVRGPMNDERAYLLAGFPAGVSARRCSDLRREEMIAPTGERAATTAGNPAQVCAITERGRAWLAAYHDADRPAQ